jgi:hypothetical protein
MVAEPRGLAGGFGMTEQNELVHNDIVPWRDEPVAPILATV